MSDEAGTNQETSQNIPTSQNSDINMGSDPSTMPPEPLESPRNADIPVSLNNDNLQNTPVLTEKPEEPKPEVLPVEGGKTEEILESVKSLEPGTAQIPPNEPLKSESEPLTQTKAEATPPPVIPTSRNRVLELLNKAKLAIQFRKRKKLDKVMSLFLQKSKITNDDVEKFLHVSDATAERYLNILEKENKIKQVGKTGKAVSYSRI
jgi:hypothetical protein